MATNYDYINRKHQNPCKIWANVIIPAAGEYLTLEADGEPDATENPNRLLLGTTEAGATTRIGKEAEDENVDEFLTPVAQNVTVRTMNLDADFNSLIEIDTLELLSSGIGTVFSDAEVEGIMIGTAEDVYFSIAAISPRNNDAAKFVVSHIYQVSVRSVLELLMSSRQRMHAPVSFVGTPVATRAPADQLGRFWWQKPGA